MGPMGPMPPWSSYIVYLCIYSLCFIYFCVFYIFYMTIYIYTYIQLPRPIRIETRSGDHKSKSKMGVASFQCSLVPGLAYTCVFLLFSAGNLKYGFGHETDSQKCYGHENTCKFDVFATRIHWTTSRTRIPPKPKKKS